MRIVLVGNYRPDAQESMQRYAELLFEGLSEAGHEVRLIAPRPVLNGSRGASAPIRKWIGYADKYVLGRPALSSAAGLPDVVHVCDHSNSIYVPLRSRVPYVVTCHDLLAVRGALGEDTDCPASFTGRQLQRSILRGLRRAQALACVSGATLKDAKRLLSGYQGKLALAPNALNYPYQVLDREDSDARLASVAGLAGAKPYVLHVGSNLRRKNREGALRSVASIASCWSGKIVFAGQPLTAELRSLAQQLGIADRVVEVVKPSNAVLEGLYNRALALLFPSRFEGFGWPIIEAQACGCPVICSDRDPLPEVAGNATLSYDADDFAGFGEGILALMRVPEARIDLSRRGVENARRYEKGAMITRLVSLYEQLGVAA